MKNENLKNIINKKNISINELSRITHLNDSHLGKIINGKTKNPGIDLANTQASNNMAS